MSKNAAIFMALAFELAGLVVGLIFLGKYFDEKFSLGGLGIAGGAILALVVWIIHLTHAMKIMDNPDDNNEKKQ